MTKNRRESFADVVKQVRGQPAAPRRSAARPGLTASGTFVSTDGVEYSDAEDVTPQVALQLASQGALVVYDSCGCGSDHGGDGLRWFASGDVRLSGSLPVLHPDRHGLAELRSWRGSDGRALVQAAGDVEWAGVMALPTT